MMDVCVLVIDSVCMCTVHAGVFASLGAYCSQYFRSKCGRQDKNRCKPQWCIRLVTCFIYLLIHLRKLIGLAHVVKVASVAFVIVFCWALWAPFTAHNIWGVILIIIRGRLLCRLWSTSPPADEEQGGGAEEDDGWQRLVVRDRDSETIMTFTTSVLCFF